MNSSLSAATASGNSTIVGWVSSDSDRSTLDILYSSGITIILCVWVSTYPNVPAPTDRWYHHLIDKANLAMIGALGPDLLFGLALGQYSSARRSVEVRSNIFRTYDYCFVKLVLSYLVFRPLPRNGPSIRGQLPTPFTLIWVGFV